MVQHLLIGDLGGLLIALGLTGPLLQPLLARRPFSWLRVLGNPLVALPIWGAQPLPLAPLGPLRRGARRARCCTSPSTPASSPSGWRCGCRWSGRCRSRPGSATGRSWSTSSSSGCSRPVLANVLIWSGTVLYPDYAPGEAKWDISPLADQGAAGNVMMIWTGTVTLGLFTWLFFRAANRSTEKQELIELAEAHGVRPRPVARRARGRRRAGRGARRSSRARDPQVPNGARLRLGLRPPQPRSSTCSSSSSGPPASAPRSPSRG